VCRSPCGLSLGSPLLRTHPSSSSTFLSWLMLLLIDPVLCCCRPCVLLAEKCSPLLTVETADALIALLPFTTHTLFYPLLRNAVVTFHTHSLQRSSLSYPNLCCFSVCSLTRRVPVEYTRHHLFEYMLQHSETPLKV
jgi:hypothetical protein